MQTDCTQERGPQGHRAHNGAGGAAQMMQDTVPIMEGRKNVRADVWRTGMLKLFVAHAEILANC